MSEHILCTCTKYEHNRQQYFPKSQLSHILHIPKRNIFNYLTDINLLTITVIFFCSLILKIDEKSTITDGFNTI